MRISADAQVAVPVTATMSLFASVNLRLATGDLFDERRGGLHPQLHVGAAAERLLEPTAISGVTALLPLTTL